MRDRSKEIPSDAEMQEAGKELLAQGVKIPGFIPDEPLRPHVRAKLAKVVQEAWREGAEQQTRKVGASSFSTPVLAIMAELTSGDDGISESSAAQIVAAVAPNIWRDTHKGAAHS